MSRTPRVNDDPRLTKLLVERGAFAQAAVSVVDVGASGGIDSYWRVFDGQLAAIGFDPLTAEVERLNGEAAPGVEYVAAWVTAPVPPGPEDERSTNFFPRTSAVRATELAALDYTRETYNAGAEVELATDRITLDGYLEANSGVRVDFLKVDTDGHDLEVLAGAERLLDSGVLGLAVEVQFHGPVSRTANLFSNVDLFLRSKGFGLFDLEVYRYSRAALPGEFLYDIPAQTTTGQVSWGESIYFRDLGDEAYEERWGFTPTGVDVLKLACFFEIFGMPDCAAELLLKYGETVASAADRAELLDLLASEQLGRTTTYPALLADFAARAKARNWRGPAAPRTAPAQPRRHGRLSRARRFRGSSR